jgi:hypothetical protein
LRSDFVKLQSLVCQEGCLPPRRIGCVLEFVEIGVACLLRRICLILSGFRVGSRLLCVRVSGVG